METLVYGVVITIILGVIYAAVSGFIEGLKGKGQPLTEQEKAAMKLGALSAIEKELFHHKK